MKLRQTKIILTLGILALIFPKPAHAYIDPGTGSYLLQIIAAAFFTSLFIFKNFWRKIKELVLKLFKTIFRKDGQSSGKTTSDNS